MSDWSSGRKEIDQTLVEMGFSATATYGKFVTYERRRDGLNVHVGPDGRFAAFGRDDEILGEGKNADDLRFILMEPVGP